MPRQPKGIYSLRRCFSCTQGRKMEQPPHPQAVAKKTSRRDRSIKKMWYRLLSPLPDVSLPLLLQTKPERIFSSLFLPLRFIKNVVPFAFPSAVVSLPLLRQTKPGRIFTHTHTHTYTCFTCTGYAHQYSAMVQREAMPGFWQTLLEKRGSSNGDACVMLPLLATILCILGGRSHACLH